MKNSKPKEQLKFRAYKFGLDVIKFIERYQKEGFVIQVICSQLLRSATSIGANIIEAQASSSKRDFLHFFLIALKSANETKYWLCLLRDGNLAPRSEIEKPLEEAESISNILGASVLTMKGKRGKVNDF